MFANRWNKNRTSSSKTRTSWSRCRLRFEGLEDRQLLAGDVTWQFKKGTLTLTGDGAGNEITVTNTGNGAYQISAAGNTTINGQAGNIVVSNVNDLVVNLKGGDDEITYEGGGNEVRNVTIKTGDGDDIVVLNNLVTDGGKLSVETAAGDDNVELNGGTVDGKTTITTGKGEDSIAVDTVQFDGNLSIDTAANIDLVTIGGSEVDGVLSVKTGAAADQLVIIATTISGKTQVETADGDDQVHLAGGNTFAGVVSLTTGNGNDTVTIDDEFSDEDNDFQANLGINVAKGNDVVNLLGNSAGNASNNTYAGTVDVLFGPGNDDLFSDFNVFQKKVRYLGDGGQNTYTPGANDVFNGGAPVLKKF